MTKEMTQKHCTLSFYFLIEFNKVLGFKGTILSGQMVSNKIVSGFQLHEVLQNICQLSAESFFPPS